MAEDDEKEGKGILGKPLVQITAIVCITLLIGGVLTIVGLSSPDAKHVDIIKILAAVFSAIFGVSLLSGGGDGQ